MNNFFINQPPYAKKVPGSFFRFANKILRRVGLSVKYSMDIRLDMNSLEQRINFYHLLTQVLQRKVPGEVIELGTFTGQCALLFQKVLDFHASDKKLHVYDSFEKKFLEKEDVEQLLIKNFEAAGLKKPAIHKGFFETTLEEQLPEKIAFAHIDCGWGGDPQDHKKVLLFCFEKIYPRMPEGGICILMDYCDPAYIQQSTVEGNPDVNPGVKMAADEFFADKPEKPVALYGGAIGHAYFQKGG